MKLIMKLCRFHRSRTLFKPESRIQSPDLLSCGFIWTCFWVWTSSWTPLEATLFKMILKYFIMYDLMKTALWWWDSRVTEGVKTTTLDEVMQQHKITASPQHYYDFTTTLLLLLLLLLLHCNMTPSLPNQHYFDHMKTQHHHCISRQHRDINTTSPL